MIEIAAGTAGAAGWALAAHCVHRLRGERELAARAGHEVRGPLTALSLALDVMERRGEAPFSRLVALQAQVERARRGLDDLVAAPQRRRAPDAIEALALSAVVARVRETWSPVAAAQARTLEVAPAPAGWLIDADRVRVDQALGNLIANALEHGAGTVRLTARIAGGRVRLEIRDEGPGLPAPVAALVRRRRGAGDARGRGLAIVDGEARRLGGRLSAAPATSGAALVLELPVRPAAARAAR